MQWNLLLILVDVSYFLVTTYLQCLSPLIHSFLIIVNFVVFGVDVSVACCLEKKAVWVYVSAEWNALQVSLAVSWSEISIGCVDRFVSFEV